MFLSKTWHEVWWNHFGDGAEPLILGFKDADRVVAIAPLMIKNRVVSFMGGTDLVDYHDILASEADHDAVANELFDVLSGLDSWDRLEFGSIPDWSPYARAIPEAAERRGWKPEVELEDVAPGLEIPDSWDDYLAGLRKKDRHELRRKMRRLDGAGDVAQTEYDSPADVEAALDEFLRLHRMSTPDKAEFMTAEREAFFRDLAVQLAEQGEIRLYFTSLDGKALATSLCFEYCGRRLVYNSGFDPEYRDLSAGLINHARFLDCCIRDDIEYADFLRGNERYKYHLGATDRSIFRVTINRDPA